MEYRVCPNCGNPEIEEANGFCWNCGLELGNCCENPECQAGDLADKFTYCPHCGSETRYAKLGFAVRLEFERDS